MGWPTHALVAPRSVTAYRRLSKDYEYDTESSEAWVRISSIQLMLRRLRPNKDSQHPPFKYPKKVKKAV